jgi:hypothetical protein
MAAGWLLLCEGFSGGHTEFLRQASHGGGFEGVYCWSLSLVVTVQSSGGSEQEEEDRVVGCIARSQLARGRVSLARR